MNSIEWLDRRYSTDAYIGRVCIGGYHYSGTVERGSELVYKATCNLPGIKSNLGNFKDSESCKARIKYAWEYWNKMLTQERKNQNNE